VGIADWNVGRAPSADLIGARQSGGQSVMNMLNAQKIREGMEQQQTIGRLAQEYIQEPNPSTLSQIAAIDPQKAQGLMNVQKQAIEQKAKGIKSLTNTFFDASESQKSLLYPEIMKRAQKEGYDASSLPLEYNKDTSEAINRALKMESDKVDQLLGIKPKERKTAKDVNERLRYVDTGELVFKGVEKQLGQDEKAPPGYRYVGATGKLEAIPGGPAEKLAGETAGKVALYKGGLEDIKEFKKYVFDEDGKLDRVFLAKMNAPFGAGRFADVRDAHSLISNAIEAKLRAETGAAATQDEIDRNVEKFMPSIRDNEKTAENKIRRLEKFLGTAIEGTMKGREPRKGSNVSDLSDDELLMSL
jgi:hypothetical protein